MSKPAAERPLWVHQDRLNLPFPAVQGTALLLKARFLLSGMGRCVKFFSLREGFFFALLLIFPFRQEKSGAQTRIKEICHKIHLTIRRSGEFFKGRSEKSMTCEHMRQKGKKPSATSRIGAAPQTPSAEEANSVTKNCCFDCWRPSSRKIRERDVTAAQDSGQDPQPGTAFFPKKAGGDSPQQEKSPPLSSTLY